MEKAASSNSNFKLYLLAAYDKIEDLIYPQYLDYLCQVLDGKLDVKYVLSRPPATWRDYNGLIDDTLLYDWISGRYTVPPLAIPPKISNYGGSSFSEHNEIPLFASPSLPTNTALLKMNERHNYMRLFAYDNSKRVKLVVCGSNLFNDSIKKNLEKLAFPVDEKAIFIN